VETSKLGKSGGRQDPPASYDQRGRARFFTNLEILSGIFAGRGEEEPIARGGGGPHEPDYWRDPPKIGPNQPMAPGSAGASGGGGAGASAKRTRSPSARPSTTSTSSGVEWRIAMGRDSTRSPGPRTRQKGRPSTSDIASTGITR